MVIVSNVKPKVVSLADLCALIPGAIVAGDGTINVRDVEHDSRDVRAGDLYACLPGATYDGHDFAADALAAGAAALAIQADHATRVPADATALVVPDTRLALGIIADAVNGKPSQSLKLVGVTGTNGKTTTTLLVAAILRAAGMSAGTIGTLGAELDGDPLHSDHTTPEADRLQALLAEMLARGAQAIAMEVSSHALAQHRIAGCRFDAAAFTNLTQDHLDYHASLDDYFAAKTRLFTDYPAASGKPFAASVNVDDERGAVLARASAGRVLTYGVRSETAHVRAVAVELAPASSRFRALTPVGEIAVRLEIGGSFQVYNALAAIGVALGLGIPTEAIIAGLAGVSAVPGRFESVPTGRGFDVIVDYAHTPDGIANLLRSAGALNPARRILVFGCGGDRDRSKRPIMGRIATENADVVVVTSDNPRTEDPGVIIREVLAGTVGSPARIIVEADRREAIRLALAEARDKDLVLVAGKGHETIQIVGAESHPFDDRAVIRELLEAL
jgi:UDP-N-acetylmuramoyl-L-alanyl-D-glutamate--2,6-diaminopimelate ligase